MKFAAAATIFFATVALANPAPVAQPEAEAAPAPAPVAQPKFEPVKVESRDQLSEALAARVAKPEAVPEINARAAGIRLDARDPKKGKPKTGSGNKTDDNAAGIISPNRALELGAIGLGVMEIVRLWG